MSSYEEYQKELAKHYYAGDRNVRRVLCEGCYRFFFTRIRNKLSCSDECQRQAQFNRDRRRRREKRTDLICGCCGKKFTPTRAGAKYCSNACRQKAYRKSVTDKAVGTNSPLKSSDDVVTDEVLLHSEEVQGA